jgi:hypothetical protein
MARSLSECLKAMNKEQRLDLLSAYMKFFVTNTLVSDTPACLAHYTCDKAVCDFAPARKKIEENAELRACEETGALLQIIDDIERNPGEFFPHRFDGFHIHCHGIGLLSLQRLGERKSVHTGMLDYNVLRNAARTRAPLPEK